MSSKNFRTFTVFDQGIYPGKGWVFDILLGVFDNPVTVGEILILEDEFITVKEIILYWDMNQRDSIIGIVSEEFYEVEEIEI